MQHHIGSSVIWLDEADSTNNIAKHLCERGACDDGAVICAHYQYAGRGQGENKWEAAKDLNLTVSIVLFPHNLHAQEQVKINLALSLGVHEFVSAYANGQASIKWPNDIYAGDKKIAGLLIENSLQGEFIRQSICGIGMNINQTHFTSSNATSLAQLTGANYELKSLLKLLINCLQRSINKMYMQDLGSLISDYEQVMYRKGLQTRFLIDKEPEEGIPMGINEEGSLRVQTGKTVTNFSNKEITWLQ